MGASRAEVRPDGRLSAFSAEFAALVERISGATPVEGGALVSLFPANDGANLQQALAQAWSEGIGLALLPQVGSLCLTLERRGDLLQLTFEDDWTVDVDEGARELLGSAMLQNVTDMIVVVDRALEVRAFNALYAAAARTILGRPLRVGDPASTVMLPEYRDAWRALVERAFSGQHVFTDFEVVLARIGRRRTYELTLNPVRSSSGSIDHVLVVSRNVTRARDEQTEAARRRAVLEAFPEAITVFDRSGSVRYYKPALDVPTPLPPERIVGRNLREFDHVPTNEIFHLLERAFESRVTERMEYDAEVDGRTRRRVALLRAISDEEALWIVRDVTEERAKAASAAETARLASLGALAAGAAHELNNPLQFVGANLEYAEERLRDDPSLHKVLAAVRDGVDGVRRMASIVRALGVFARPEDPAGSLTDVDASAHAAVRLTRHVVDARATLELTRGSPELPLRARISETRLTQVISNLVINAAHALSEQTRSRNRIEIALDGTPDEVTISVRDNGTGIPADVLPRIFDPFFTTKPVGQGTGLGLAVCQSIVAAAGGSLRVESQVGVGSVFRVTLPRAHSTDASAEAVAIDETLRGTVLVVDDDPAIRTALARSLAPLEVVLAASPSEALAKLPGTEFDLVLCDVTMPDGGGVHPYQEIVARWPALAPRVVLMTGGAIRQEDRAFLADSPAAVLAKPFYARDVHALLLRLRERASPK